MNRECLKKNLLIKKENIKEKETALIVRVLAIEDDRVLVIDCMKKIMPVWMDMEELQDFVEVKEDKQSDLQNSDILKDCDAVTKKIIYQRFNVISAILPFVADEAVRSVMIAKAAEDYGISKQTVRKYLCEYLSAQNIRSLAPQVRKPDENPRPLTQDEKNMRKALNRYYYTTKKRTLKSVYTLMLKDSYCNSEGKLVAIYPSFYQFRYFFRKYNTKQTQYISRNGLSYYQRNQRPLVGDGVQAFAPNVGVGMLDATVLDIYLVNEAGGIVGRPILTACVDAYSGLCCGYSLSWEGGTYSLRDMLLNVVSDKTEHCKRFGIEIGEKDWNCKSLPGKLVTDKGSEYKGTTFEQITDLGVQIVNLPPYRPELKSKVEKFFDCIQNYYKNHLKGKGVVEPDFQERGVHDYRKDACLTMADFEKIIIHCILFYNTQRVLENFPYTEEMLSMDIKPYANVIWDYGCMQAGCNLIRVGREELILTLLPRTTGRFTKHGLKVNGLHYHNINFSEQYLNGKECDVAYNAENVRQIWLIENGTYIPFELIESRFRDKNLDGVQAMKQRQKDLVRQEMQNKTQAEIDLARHIGVIAGSADNKESPPIKNIRENRKKEQNKLHKDFIKEVMNNA